MNESIPVLRFTVLSALILAPAFGGTLTGRIVDATGKPVSGASVSLDQNKSTALTDAQGRFTLATPVSIVTRRGHTRGSGPERASHAQAGALKFSEGNVRVSSGEGTYSVAGRNLQERGNPAPGFILGDADLGPGEASPALGKASAAWKDTLAVSKTAYLTQRIVPPNGDGDVGDIVLRGIFPGSPTKFFGFDQYNFTVSGKSCLVVVPKKAKAGNPWIWRTYFWAHKPLFDSIMCANGYYLAFMDAPNLYGAPSAVASMSAFHSELTSKYGFSKKANLVGVSRGAFYAYNWGRDNIDKISTLYGDGAGMDYVSWPCGCYGTGAGSAGDWTALKNVFGFANDAEAKAYRGNPYQNMKPFAMAKVPIIHVYGMIDNVAPPNENVLKANDSLKAYGWQMKLLPKPNTGHVHGLGPEDGGLPGQLDTLVQFVLRNTTF
jgi:hypothetical protein